VLETDDLIRSHFDVFLNLNQRLAEMRRIFSLATVFLSAVTFDVTMATSGIIGCHGTRQWRTRQLVDARYQWSNQDMIITKMRWFSDARYITMLVPVL